MKEAAGEANMTVLVITLIGVVAVTGAVLIPRLAKKSINTSCCTEAGGIWKNGSCVEATGITYDQEAYNKCLKETK